MIIMTIMTRKIAAALLVVDALAVPGAASAASWTRGQCIDAVRQQLGTRAADAGRTLNKAAVHRCLRFGPGSID
jgi:hypothetical protein